MKARILPFLLAALLSPASLPDANAQRPQEFLRSAREKRSGGNPDGAIADYDSALRINPDVFVAYFERGNVHQSKGDFKAAIADYDRALRLMPNHGPTINSRGSARLGLGDREGSLADFNRAIEIDPRYGMAYRNRALWKQEGGDSDGAIADYDEALAINPNDAQAAAARALLRREGGRGRAMAFALVSFAVMGAMVFLIQRYDRKKRERAAWGAGTV